MILLDPTHPDHFRRMNEDAPATASVLNAASKLFSPTMRREFDAQAKCLDTLAGSKPIDAPVRLFVRSEFQAIEKGAFETMTRQLAEDWRALAGADRVEVVPGSGHYIQNDRPDIVVQAIRGALLARRPGYHVK